ELTEALLPGGVHVVFAGVQNRRGNFQAQVAKIADDGVARGSFAGAELGNFPVVSANLRDTFHLFISRGAIGEKTPGIFRPRELHGPVPSQELAHWHDALFFDLTRDAY